MEKVFTKTKQETRNKLRALWRKWNAGFCGFFFPPNLLLPSSENEDGGEGHTAYEGQKAHATSSPRPPQCKQTSEMQMTNRREPAEVHSCLFPFFSLACKRRALENSFFCQGPVERPPWQGPLIQRLCPLFLIEPIIRLTNLNQKWRWCEQSITQFH